jgi:hypothetical protein
VTITMKKANPDNFSMIAVNPVIGQNKLQALDIRDIEFRQVRDYFKRLWG